jgi:LmbE family N-acetylglucosaminyl deacetylase
MLDTFQKLYHQLKIEIIKIHLRKKFSPIENFKSAVIMAPHPDDELLGCGGIIQQLIQMGTIVNIIFLTDGEKSLEDIDEESIKAYRIKLSVEACNLLNIPQENIYRLHLSDSKVPGRINKGFKEAVESLLNIIKTIQPDVIFTTHYLDTWPNDHVAAYEIAKDAINKFKQKISLRLYWVWLWYCIPTSNLLKMESFKNSYKIDIKDQLPLKKQLIRLYLKTLAPNGKPWSGVLPKGLIQQFYKTYEVITIDQ